MPKILIPTDFSNAALKATEYGTRLAAALNYDIILFHAVGLPMIRGTEDMELVASTDLERVENEQLEQIRHELRKRHPEVIIAVNSTMGFPVEEIRNACEENSVDLVVMGTKGAGGIKEILVGSNTGSLIHETECPVLAVPEEAVYKNPEHIVFATNMLRDDAHSLKDVIRLFGKLNPQITLLHIEDGHRRDAEAVTMDWFRKEILPSLNYENVKLEVLSETDVVKSLHAYLEDNKADMLVTATRKRNLIERLFDRRITRKLVFHTHVPLLALRTHSSKGEILL